jgi:hypothetical protein
MTIDQDNSLVDPVADLYQREAEQVLDDLSAALDAWAGGASQARHDASDCLHWLIEMAIAMRHRRTVAVATELHSVVSSPLAQSHGLRGVDPDGSLATEALLALRRLVAGGRCRPSTVARLRDACSAQVLVFPSD